MDGLRARLLALRTYRFTPYLMTAVVLLLASAGLDAHDGGEDGWNCFICGCGWLGSHMLPPPYGCWWPPLFVNCWVHPGELCSWIRTEA